MSLGQQLRHFNVLFEEAATDFFFLDAHDDNDTIGFGLNWS